MLERFYLGLPRRLQNVSVTAYGYKMYRQRFGGSIPQVYADIESVFEPVTDLTFSLQRQRFNNLIKHASINVPFYKSIFEQQRVRAEDVTIENMSDIFPKISKRDILAEPDAFISTGGRYSKNTMSLYTSGSSGTPLRVESDTEARRINYFYYELALAEYGVGYRSKSTTFAGRLLYSRADNRPSRMDYYNRTQYLSSYQISPDTVASYIRELNQWKPLYIDGYPSVLIEIANLAEAGNLSLNFSPKVILTSSETLSELGRDQIENFFRAPVMDHYGCTEMSISAFCRQDKYYVHPLYCVVELESMGEGVHSLITTGLLNFSMPLIRYEIGDTVATDSPENPYCYNSIVGRVGDLIRTPEGRAVGRLGPAFKNVGHILLAQIVQHALDRLEIRLVLADKLNGSIDEALLIRNLRERTSEKMHIKLSYHDDIERGANGKFKFVICLL